MLQYSKKDPSSMNKKLQPSIYGENQNVTACAQGKAQKRPEKTFNLYLRLILSAKTDYGNKNKKKS